MITIIMRSGRTMSKQTTATTSIVGNNLYPNGGSPPPPVIKVKSGKVVNQLDPWQQKLYQGCYCKSLTNLLKKILIIISYF